jgi:mannosyl-3-phosphoglycerate phosphatase
LTITKYDELIKTIDEIKQKYKIQSFSDMSDKELSDDANLTLAQAQLAKKREYDLPFKILNKDQEEEIFDYINNQGLRITKGGRYYHLIGDNDKGKAVKELSNLYKDKFESIRTIGIGDSENDFPMLDAVDTPYLVRRYDGSYASCNYLISGDIGPEGWEKVIEIELK